MPAISITVAGATEVIEGLKRLPAALAGDTLEQAATAGASLLCEVIQQRAPERSGQLKRDIRVATLEKSSLHAVAGIGVTKKGFYWRFQELGTRKQPARPFIRPAADEMQQQVESAIQSVLAAAVRSE